MAEFKNNAFTIDTNDQHGHRVDICVEGMATYDAELAFRGDLVDDMTAHRDTWHGLEVSHVDEWADEKDATAIINNIEKEITEVIVSIRSMVDSMLAEEEVIGISEHDIRDGFAAVGRIPRSTEGLKRVANQMIATNVRFHDEGNPYALPEAQFDTLSELLDDLEDAVNNRLDELRQAKHVGKQKELERKKGDRLLLQAFKWTVANWGDDDERLLQLGFVPKSQIHTPGDPPPDWPDWPGPAETFTASIIEPGVVELVYSGVKESTIGWLHRRKVGIVDWTLVADDLPMNAEDIVPFRDYDVLPATWEYRFIPMRGDEHGEASYAIIEVE